MDAPELPVDPLGVLRKRSSANWQTYPADVLPLTVAEMDFALAEPVAQALRRFRSTSSGSTGSSGASIWVPPLVRADPLPVVPRRQPASCRRRASPPRPAR